VAQTGSQAAQQADRRAAGERSGRLTDFVAAGFGWDSCRKGQWYKKLQDRIEDLKVGRLQHVPQLTQHHHWQHTAANLPSSTCMVHAGLVLRLLCCRTFLAASSCHRAQLVGVHSCSSADMVTLLTPFANRMPPARTCGCRHPANPCPTRCALVAAAAAATAVVAAAASIPPLHVHTAAGHPGTNSTSWQQQL
jgi:hypothetical protein